MSHRPSPSPKERSSLLQKTLPAPFLCSCQTLCKSIDCSPPGSSVHGIFPGKNTRVGCHFQLRDRTHLSCISCIGRQILFFFFVLKDNCFTEFCYFLSNLNTNQPKVCICPLPLEAPSHLPPHPISLD